MIYDNCGFGFRKCGHVRGAVKLFMATMQPAAGSREAVLRQCSDVMELQHQLILKLQEEKVRGYVLVVKQTGGRCYYSFYVCTSTCTATTRRHPKCVYLSGGLRGRLQRTTGESEEREALGRPAVGTQLAQRGWSYQLNVKLIKNSWHFETFTCFT